MFRPAGANQSPPQSGALPLSAPARRSRQQLASRRRRSCPAKGQGQKPRSRRATHRAATSKSRRHPHRGQRRSYVSALDSGGNFRWARGMSSADSKNYAWLEALAMDGQGDVYAAGILWGRSISQVLWKPPVRGTCTKNPLRTGARFSGPDHADQRANRTPLNCHRAPAGKKFRYVARM